MATLINPLERVWRDVMTIVQRALIAVCLVAISRTSLAQSNQIVHRFTSTSTIVEHGDTVKLISEYNGNPSARKGDSISGMTRNDTIVLLVRGTSATLIRPGMALKPVPDFLAKHVLNLLKEARAKEAIERKLGRSLN